MLWFTKKKKKKINRNKANDEKSTPLSKGCPLKFYIFYYSL